MKIKSVKVIEIEDENTAQPKLRIKYWPENEVTIKLNQEQLGKITEEVKVDERDIQ